jgi:hypothetical protein
MKIHIFDGQEAYPVYTICNVIDENDCYDVDLETLKRWKKASNDFIQFQIELADLVRDRSDHDRDYDIEYWDPMEIDIE